MMDIVDMYLRRKIFAAMYLKHTMKKNQMTKGYKYLNKVMLHSICVLLSLNFYNAGLDISKGIFIIELHSVVFVF